MVGVTGLGQAGNTLARGGGLGEALLIANRGGKGVDVAGLSRDLAQLAQRDPKGAADAIEAARKGLSPVERGEFDRALPQSIADAQRAGQATPKGLAGPQKELALDLTQMGLDVAGLFDPTPVSDGANGVISLLRGDLLGAGISAVSMIPYIGDAAKLGKLGNWAKTVTHAVEIAKTDSAFARAAKPALDAISNAIGAAPKKLLDALPQSARDTLTSMKRQIDGLGGAAAKKADDVAALGSASAKVGRNEVKWTLDAKGRPTTATATLSDLQPKGAARSGAETSAQDAVRARGLADDDAGHIIGHRFLSDQGTRNMFPQNFNFNRSAYKTMENEWAGWIDAGATVKVNVALKGGDGTRPDKVAVVYEVFNDAGKSLYKKIASFDNTSGQTFSRVSSADIRAKTGAVTAAAAILAGASMTTSTFDQARAADALDALARRVLADPNYAGEDWRGVALVIEVGDATSMSGYLYGADDWKPETPDDFDVLEDAEALAEAMATGGERWRRCLLQITREPGGAPQLNAAFDYDGTADWTVTPANVDEMVETLRPRRS